MELLAGVTCMALGAFIFCVTLIGGRNPRRPRWASNGMVANLYVPLVMALWAIGVAYLVIVMVNLETRPLALWEATTSAVIALVAAVAIKALKIGARLKQYASEETTDARIIQLNPDAPEPKIPPGAGRAAA